MELGADAGGQIRSVVQVLETDADTARLVELALGIPESGLDDWALEPLTPLPSPFASPTASPSLSPASPVLDPPALPSALPPLYQLSHPFPSLSTFAGHANSTQTRPPQAPPLPQPLGTSSNAKTRAKDGKRIRRQAKRIAARGDPFSAKVKAAAAAKFVASAVSQPVRSSLDVKKLPIAVGGYVGVNQKVKKDLFTLEELRAEGYGYYAWDGVRPFVITDKDGLVVALFAGQPKDPDWPSVVQEASRALAIAADLCSFDDSDVDHRRGKFATLARGISFGGGRKAPGRVGNKSKNEKALRELCANPAIGRIAGFGSNMLATYAPLAYANMRDRLSQLFAHHPSLRLNFPNSIYPAVSINFGPSTACYPHTDAANDPCNWCHITALGQFNPRTSGHIVLHNLKAVFEFPPGSSSLIPSAIFEHGNVPVQPNETRQSLTQYCAGGLLRWVECGFRTLGDFSRSDPGGKAAFDASLKDRASRCIRRFSHIDALASGARMTDGEKGRLAVGGLLGG